MEDDKGAAILNLNELTHWEPKPIRNVTPVDFIRTGDNLIYVDNPEAMTTRWLPSETSDCGYFIAVDLEEGKKYSVENYTNVYMDGTLGVVIQNTVSTDGYIDIFTKSWDDLAAKAENMEDIPPEISSIKDKVARDKALATLHNRRKCENAIEMNYVFRNGLNEERPIEADCKIPANGVKIIYSKNYPSRSVNGRLKFLCNSSGLIAKVFIIDNAKTSTDSKDMSDKLKGMKRIKYETGKDKEGNDFDASFTTSFFEYDTLVGTVNLLEETMFYVPGVFGNELWEGRRELPLNNNEYSALKGNLHNGQSEIFYGGLERAHLINGEKITDKIHFGNFGMLYNIKLNGDVSNKVVRMTFKVQPGGHIIMTDGEWLKMPFMQLNTPYTFDPKNNEFQFVFCGANAAPVEFEVTDGLKTKIEITIGSRVMKVNGDIVNLHADPHIKDGYTMVPVRAVAEHMLGIQNVEWDGDAKQITITNGYKQAIMIIDSETLVLKDTQTGISTVETMEVAPYIRNGYSFLPLRTLGERILGLSPDKITWDANSKTARFN